ncbi:MAG: putative nucleic-acid-binding Zn-ribbon protein [Acidimicrobiales bacterium]|jgi:predicted nucleic-acid-binding Zn-ribbon protein
MEHNNHKCAKCESQELSPGQLRVAGGFWTKLFNIQNLTFVTLSCNQCGYTEMYKKGTRTAENILDFFTN